MQVRAYLRVSTEEQAEEGFSIPAQRQRVVDFCRSQWGAGAAIAWYVDEGQSARDLERPALTRLRAEAGRGDLVMVLRLDRLTRSVLDLYTLLKEWECRGVGFRSVTEPYDTGSTEGRFMIGLLALLAEWERLRIAERVREVMAHTVRQERRHLSRPPLGYQLAGGHLVVDEAEAALVRELFARYAAGQGTRTIARALNRRGKRTKQGREWTDVSVAYVLRNPAYTGHVAWGRVVRRGRRRPEPDGTLLVAGAHPPLVDSATWNRVQERLAEQGRRPSRQGVGSHPLSGLARCELCGAPVHGLTQRRGGRGERSYYRCANRQRKGGCSLPYLPAPLLEARVLQQLSPLGEAGILQQVAQRLHKEGEATPLEAERQELERRLRRWDQAYEAGDLSREEWRERTAPLRRRQTELARVTATPESPTATPTTPGAGLARALADLPGLWPWLTADERRTALRGLVESVVVRTDGSARVTPKEYLRVAHRPARGTP